MQTNRVVLGGKVAKILDQRFTPSGIPITRFVLEHQSQQSEAGLKREIYCNVLIIVSGSELNKIFEQIELAQEITVTGFINQTAFQGRKQKLCVNAELITF